MTIFPILIKDTEDLVLACTSPKSLVSLSGVNKYAYVKLSNASHFKALFSEKYPLLAKTDRVYSQLKAFYPDSCWKLACSSMTENYIPFTFEFLERAKGPMTDGFNTQKQEIIDKKCAAQRAFKRICGSHYADPHSPIHQAWESWREHQLKYQAFFTSIKEETEKLLAPMKNVIERIANDYQLPFYVDHQKFPKEAKIEIATNILIEFLIDERQLALLAMGAVQGSTPAQFLSASNIDQYRKLSSALLEIIEKEAKRKKQSSFLCDTYRKLEFQQKFSVEEVRLCSKEMIKVEKKLTEVSKINRSLLLIDHFFSRNAEKIMYDVDRLATMRNIAHDLESVSNSEMCASYRSRINACKQGTLIWELLYHRCANGVDEEQWAENHFHEFPYELQEIVTKLSFLAQSFKKVYFENLDFSMQCFAEENFEVIKDRLPFLKEFLKDPLRLLKIDATANILSSEQVDFFRAGVSPQVFKLLVLQDPIRYLAVNNLTSMFPILSLLIKHTELHEDRQTLYQSQEINTYFSASKPRGSIDRKSVHIANID